jgi:AbrB family looped-hinge helix DNA binding protein
MEQATLTSKSQITVPKAVREALGLVPGDRIQFVPAWQGYRLVVVRGDITAVRGILKGRRRKPLSIAAMNAAIAQMGSMSEDQARTRFADRASSKTPRRRKTGR